MDFENVLILFTALLGALGGLSGLGALFKALSENTRNEFLSLEATVKLLQAENGRLAERNYEISCRLDILEGDLEALEAENRCLKRLLEERGLDTGDCKGDDDSNKRASRQRPVRSNADLPS